ncbi:acyltransferase family protein [Sodalis glossinidius]|uniref:acyltransferase family protein n=1 Tax=Sodalis glossinidius TaxID=63612 RepID=UPI00311CA49A
MNLDTCMSDASHLWFLFSIINLYFILPLLRFAFVKAQRAMLTNVIAALFIIANVSLLENALTAGLGIASIIDVESVNGVSQLFIGWLSRSLFPAPAFAAEGNGGLILLALASFTLLVWLTQRWGINFFYGKTYNVFLQGAAISVFILLLCSRVKRLEKIISHVGNKTLGIYLVHNIFIM